MAGHFAPSEMLGQIRGESGRADRDHAHGVERQRNAEFFLGSLVVEARDGVGDEPGSRGLERELRPGGTSIEVMRRAAAVAPLGHDQDECARALAPAPVAGRQPREKSLPLDTAVAKRHHESPGLLVE